MPFENQSPDDHIRPLISNPSAVAVIALPTESSKRDEARRSLQLAGWRAGISIRWAMRNGAAVLHRGSIICRYGTNISRAMPDLASVIALLREVKHIDIALHPQDPPSTAVLAVIEARLPLMTANSSTATKIYLSLEVDRRRAITTGSTATAPGPRDAQDRPPNL